ncbi:MAG: twin-arginine translocase TatA/TatE family subunit [Deltaproteobacteria bacterium]|nr:twin-arginine translocase TatA/TatE family subunit [Deltaproteobacteria bacterium]
MFGLGTSEVIVIALLILVFFGARRLPEIGEGLGKAIREFRNVKKDLAQDDKRDDEDADSVNKGPSLEKKIASKVADQVSERIPAIRQAKKLKDGADKLKNLLS